MSVFENTLYIREMYIHYFSECLLLNEYTFTNNSNIFTSENNDNVQICAAEILPFLKMNIIWSTEGDLQFGISRKKVQQLKYDGKGTTHIPNPLGAILSVLLNHLSKITSRNPELHSKWVLSIYPDHANTLRSAGLAP